MITEHMRASDNDDITPRPGDITIGLRENERNVDSKQQGRIFKASTQKKNN